MPSSSEDRQHALTIMEWAHDDAVAEASDPELVAAYREVCKRPFGSEAHWRTAYDLALDIWAKAREEQLKKQSAF
jgi:hypothetical protein